MPEIGQPAERRYAQHLRRPACRQLPFAAPTASLRLLLPVAALENGIGLAPARRRQCGLPHRLRLGTIDGDTAEAFELAAIAAVEQDVVGKARRGEHAELGAGLGAAPGWRRWLGSNLVRRHRASTP